MSRREFMKLAGIAGATIGVGAGLGGFGRVRQRGVDYHDGRGQHDHPIAQSYV